MGVDFRRNSFDFRWKFRKRRVLSRREIKCKTSSCTSHKEASNDIILIWIIWEAFPGQTKTKNWRISFFAKIFHDEVNNRMSPEWIRSKEHPQPPLATSCYLLLTFLFDFFKFDFLQHFENFGVCQMSRSVQFMKVDAERKTNSHDNLDLTN